MSVKTLLKDYQEPDYEADAFYTRERFDEPVLRKRSRCTGYYKRHPDAKIRNNHTNDQYVRIPLERLDQIIDIIQRVEKIHNSVKNEAALRFGSNDRLL